MQRFIRGNCSEVGLMFEGFEATLYIIGHSRRIIQSTGVQPDAVCALKPCLLDSETEQVPA